MLDQQIERERIAARFVRESSRFLHSQKPSERNVAGMVISATAASFLSDRSFFQDFEKLWTATPHGDFGANARLDEVISKFRKDCAPLTRQELSIVIHKIAPKRYELCSRNDITVEEALQTAENALAVEEVACTFAVLGHYELAREVINQPTLEDFRKDNINWVIEAEKLREGDLAAPDFEALGLKDWGADPWQAGYTALCALGRQPYVGYPYPDW